MEIDNLLQVKSIDDVSSHLKTDFSRSKVLTRSSGLLSTLAIGSGKNITERNFEVGVEQTRGPRNDYMMKEDVGKFQKVVKEESVKQKQAGNYLIAQQLASTGNYVRCELAETLKIARNASQKRQKEMLTSAQETLANLQLVQAEEKYKAEIQLGPKKLEELREQQKLEVENLERSFLKIPIYRASKSVIEARKLEREALKSEQFEIATKYRETHLALEKVEREEHIRAFEEKKETKRSEMKKRHEVELKHMDQFVNDVVIVAEKKKKVERKQLAKSFSIQDSLLHHAQCLERRERIETSVRPVVLPRKHVALSSANLGGILADRVISRTNQNANSTIQRSISLSALHDFSSNVEFSQTISSLEASKFLALKTK